jgi:hypothetical protein
LEFINDEPKFEVEAMLKSKQSQGHEWEYVVKWKSYRAIESPWVKESNMDMPKKALKPSTTNWQKTKRKLGCDEDNFFKWGRKLEWLKSENILYQFEL